MKILKWIVQTLLAIAFLGAGLMKMMTPYQELISNPDMAWANDFSPLYIKSIATLEILRAIGLILPLLLKKMKFFVPLAAIGLGMTMIGAMVVHLGRSEPIVPNVVLLILAVSVVLLRKDLLKFS